MSLLQFGVKVAVSAVVIVAVSEIARRSTFWAAALASLPLTSILAFVWLYLDTGDVSRVAALSTGILWLVLPSLVFFVVLPLLLRAGLSFWLGMACAAAATAGAYALMLRVLAVLGVKP